MFLMWLGEQITARGIGNGISLIIFAGIVAGLPAAISGTLELGRTGALSTGLILAIIVLAVVVIALIVFFERAQRRLLIQYPKRQVGNRMFQGDTSHLPLKLNTSGVIPPIFASSLLLLPATVAGFSATTDMPGWASAILAALGHGQPLYMALYAAMIAFFAFFYTAIVFNPKDTADQLKKHSGFIPGYRPGRAHRRIYRLRAHPHHRDRRDLPRGRLPAAGIPDFGDWRALLPRWHFASDCGQCYARYGCADSGPPDRAPV